MSLPHYHSNFCLSLLSQEQGEHLVHLCNPSTIQDLYIKDAPWRWVMNEDMWWRGNPLWTGLLQCIAHAFFCITSEQYDFTSLPLRFLTYLTGRLIATYSTYLSGLLWGPNHIIAWHLLHEVSLPWVWIAECCLKKIFFSWLNIFLLW